jgi:hypothetical protein
MTETTCDCCGESVDLDSPDTYQQFWVRERTYPTGWTETETWPREKYAHPRCVEDHNYAPEAAEGGKA